MTEGVQATPEVAGGGRRVAVALLFGALVLGLFFTFFKAFGSDPHAVPFKLVNQPAPDFTLKRIGRDETVSLASFKGKPVVINFWASWCGPCRYDHPVLEWGHQRFGDHAQFLGVVFEDTEENAQRFLAELGQSFPQLMDEKSGMVVDYGVSGVPETYFIDAQGMIRGKVVGPISPQVLAARLNDLKGPVSALERAP